MPKAFLPLQQPQTLLNLKLSQDSSTQLNSLEPNKATIAPNPKPKRIERVNTRSANAANESSSKKSGNDGQRKDGKEKLVKDDGDKESRIKCFGCKEKGHKISECPKRTTKSANAVVALESGMVTSDEESQITKESESGMKALV